MPPHNFIQADGSLRARNYPISRLLRIRLFDIRSAEYLWGTTILRLAPASNSSLPPFPDLYHRRRVGR